MVQHGRTSVYEFHFHLVWVTKYRQSIFDTEEKRRYLKAAIQQVAAKNGITIEEIEILPEHVHLIVSFPPYMVATAVVKILKGSSARHWFIHYPETRALLWGGHLWSTNYFMSTLGAVSKKIVSRYIKAQLTHYNGGHPRVNSSQH